MVMKDIEARLIIMVGQLFPSLRYARHISKKLTKDYGNISLLLDGMSMKGWLKRNKSSTKVLYTISDPVIHKQAVEKLNEAK